MITIPEGVTHVATADAADAAAREIALSSEIAVDVETNGMHAFRAKLCFVQVATETAVYVFDCLAPGVDIRILGATFDDATRTKFFHAAGNDLRVLADAGVRVSGIFDTHRAATLLALVKVGLADLVLARFGVVLDKSLQQSDFSLRPVPDDLGAYIADDVRYLVDVGRDLRARCAEGDILEEVQLDCDRIADDARAPQPAVVAASDESGEPKSSDDLLEAELKRTRLVWAERLNVPFGRVLSNASVTAIVAERPMNMRTLSRLSGVTQPLLREHGAALLAIVAAAPPRPPRVEGEEKSPRRGDSFIARDWSDALKAFRTTAAKERNVSPSVVLPNPLMKDLVRLAPQSLEELARLPYLGDKRLARYGDALVAIFAPKA